jgi:hypothetical protein
VQLRGASVPDELDESNRTNEPIDPNASAAPVEWTFRLQGQEYGPVLTDRLDALCRAGVIRVDTRVLGSGMRRWTDAGMVPALRVAIAPVPVLPTVREGLLRDIPCTALNRPWFEVPRLGVEGSAWVLGSLGFAAAGVGALHWTNYVSGENTFGHFGATLGVVVGTFATGLVIGFLGMLFACYCSVRRPRSVAVTGFSVGAGLVVLCAAGAQVSSLAREHEARVQTKSAALQQIEDARASLDRIVVIPRQVVVAAIRPVNQPPRNPARDNALVQGVLQAIRDEATASRERYLAAVRAMDVKRTLDPAQLADPNTNGPARQRLRAAGAALSAMEAEVHKILDSASARIAACGASPEAQRQAVASFAPTRQRSEQTLVQLTRMERQIFADVSVILELARARAGKTSVVGGRLVFFNSADAAIYGRKLDEIKSLGKQERNLMRADRMPENDPSTALAGIAATAE